MKPIRIFFLMAMGIYSASCSKVEQLEMPASSDTKETFTYTTDTVISKYSYNDMFFFDERKGIAVGNEGRIIKTIDGGASWHSIPSGIHQSIRSVEFINENTAWAASTGCLLKTTDGGNSWSVVTGPAAIPASRNVYSVSFRNESNGIAVCQGGGTAGSFILVTSDGGATWTGKTVPQVNGLAAVNDLRRIAWYDDSTAYAVGAAGTIIKTTDKGNNWTQVNTVKLEAGTVRYNNLTFIKDIGYAAGQSGIVLKIEPLQNDKITLLPLYTVNDGQNDCFFTDPNTGYMAGQYGELHKTSDGGASWVSQNIVSAALALRSVQVFPSGKVYVIGNGIFLKRD